MIDNLRNIILILYLVLLIETLICIIWLNYKLSNGFK